MEESMERAPEPMYDAVERVAADTWRCGDVSITLQVDSRQAVYTRTVDGEEELIVLLVFHGKDIRFDEVIRW